MKSIIIDDYEAKPPQAHPAQPDVIMLAFAVPNSDETYVFAMSVENATQYHERLGVEIRKATAPTIFTPTGADIANATRTRR